VSIAGHPVHGQALTHDLVDRGLHEAGGDALAAAEAFAIAHDLAHVIGDMGGELADRGGELAQRRRGVIVLQIAGDILRNASARKENRVHADSGIVPRRVNPFDDWYNTSRMENCGIAIGSLAHHQLSFEHHAAGFSEAASADVDADDPGAPPMIEAVPVNRLAELPNDGTPLSGGVRRKSSRVRTIGPTNPDGSVVNFSIAATLIRVRNLSKDFRRSITVDGTVRPDAASNASSETAQLIRRMPSRISKRIKSPSRGKAAWRVVLIIDPFVTVGCVRRDRRRPPTFDRLFHCGVGDAFGFSISRLPRFCLMAILPSLSS
jgi:hypothetical protein